MTANRWARARLLRRIGWGILIGGLTAAAIIFIFSPVDQATDTSGLAVAGVNNSKRYQLQLERIGGKAAVALDEFDDWLASLWTGQRLAVTVAVLSIGASLLCFVASGGAPPGGDHSEE